MAQLKDLIVTGPARIVGDLHLNGTINGFTLGCSVPSNAVFTDTNTWRTIQCNGTSIGSNTLNLKDGTNVSLSRSNGTITISATDTTYTAGTNISISNTNVISATDTTYNAATQSTAGLMSAADKKKLDGIASGANAYSLPLAADGTRGGIQIGYAPAGANIPLRLSLNEKGYVTLTSSAVTTALGFTPYSAAGGTINGDATVKGTLKVYDGTNVASLKMDGTSLSINTELKLTAGGSSDICPNIKAAIKAKVFQASDLICENIYLGTTSGNASTLPLKIRKYTNTTGNVPVSGNSDVLVTVGTDGKVTSVGGFFDTSDERLKNFHEDVPVDFDKLRAIPKKYFTWKDDEKQELQLGTSAQAIQKIYPELVNVDENGELSVAYNKLSVIALAAIDKLEDRVKMLEDKIEMLLTKLN